MSHPSSPPAGRAFSDAATRLRQRASAPDHAVPSDRPRTLPPEENGVRLATIRRGEDEEVRLSWAEYNGRHFLNLRVWNRRSSGWWPDREKGLTVRVRELPDFVEGVAKAAELAAKEPPRGA